MLRGGSMLPQHPRCRRNLDATRRSVSETPSPGPGDSVTNPSVARSLNTIAAFSGTPNNDRSAPRAVGREHFLGRTSPIRLVPFLARCPGQWRQRWFIPSNSIGITLLRSSGRYMWQSHLKADDAAGKARRHAPSRTGDVLQCLRNH